MGSMRPGFRDWFEGGWPTGSDFGLFFCRLSSFAITLKHCITACYKILFPVTTLITPVTRNRCYAPWNG